MYHEMKLTGLLAVPRDYRVCEHVTSERASERVSERGMRASPFLTGLLFPVPPSFN